MTSNEILKADLLDIVFDNRNKQYGAYALRKKYKSRLIISLAIALSSMFLLFLLQNKGIINPGGPMQRVETVELKNIEMPKALPKVIHFPKLPSLPRLPNSVIPPDLSNIKMKPDINATTLIPDIRSIENIPLSGLPGTGQPNGTLNGNINSDLTDKKDNTNGKEFTPVEKQPEFPGGMAAWSRFLTKYLKTPDDIEAGEKKTVLIRFQVAADGSVTNFDIVKSAGTEYDNEVIRVLKKMPKWNPAIQNGHPISVSFMQPVTFIGPEQ